MIGIESLAEAPEAARYHQEAIEQIIQSVEERIYCALLGPRLCGKTQLLRFIESRLAPLLGWTCAFIDLQGVRAVTQRDFFTDLIQQTARSIHEQTGSAPVPPEGVPASSAVFRAFLVDCLAQMDGDLVLMIDPLEALPSDLVQALLTSLRAAYMDQQGLEQQVTVVVSGALSLATMAVGESSPFRGIARRVFVGDLSEVESHALLLEHIANHGIGVTRTATFKLLAATKGDTYLIRRITQRCAELVTTRRTRLLRSRDIDYVVNRFLRDEVFQYAPLVEAIRMIEEDPDLVECILRLLEQERIPRSELPLPLSPDLDPLYLTGVVEVTGSDEYRLQNLIYRRTLAQHLTPARVGHVLAMAGRWDSAINYLESSIRQGNHQSRTDLLPATINSIYAAQDLGQAVHFLRRGLAAAFGVSESQVWLTPPQEKLLRLVGPAGVNFGSQALTDLQIALSADRLETRAYRQQVPLRGQEGDQRAVRAIPLIIPGRKPIGVITIFDELLAEHPMDHLAAEVRDRDLQLTAFLNQAARALLTVSTRRQELELAGRMQASLLPLSLPQVTGWQLAATWRPARETSGDFYDVIPLPGGLVGLVIADVVDKGMGAALLMALSRTLIRTYADDYPDEPERLLHIANRRIIADIGGGLFVTLFYGVLDPTTGRLIYCNAGHPPPHLFPWEKGLPVESLFRTGIPLGISEDAVWERAAIDISPGAVLLLYTDGVYDSQNSQGEFFGERGVLSTVQSMRESSARQIQEGLFSALLNFAGSEPQADDISLMILKREGS